MILKVIGAGFGRTGTESMKRALEMLGFGPCYHMYEVLPHQDRVKMWRGILRGAVPDWDAVFEGYQATVDWPAAHYWRDLAAHYPDAKILLTVRSSESWYASMDKTILQVLRDPADPDSIGQQLGRAVFDGRLDDRDHVIAAYERNIAEVQAAFGPERLLTYTLGDGWGPLCAFLGCPEPAADYPRSNAPGQFHQTLDDLTSARGT